MLKNYTFLVPHNPLIISKIGGIYSDKLQASIMAIKKIREKIYEINPSKIFIFTPPSYETQKIVINQSEKYLVDFQEFGNLSMQFEVNGDLDFSTRLKYYLRKNDFDVNLFSEKRLDYHTFVPMYYLNKLHTWSKGFENELKATENIKTEFITIHASENDLEYHKKFGDLFYDFIKESKERVLIIICGDFVKKPNKKNPYDKDLVSKLSYKIIDLLKEKKYDEIIKIEELKNNYYPWVKPFLMALPIISKYKSNPSILSLDKEFEEMYLNLEF